MDYCFYFIAVLAAFAAFVGVIGYLAREDFGELCFGIVFGLMSTWGFLACEGVSGYFVISCTLLALAFRSLGRAWDYRP